MRQSLEAIGRIPHMFYILFPLVQDRCASASCGTMLHLASAVGFDTDSGTVYWNVECSSSTCRSKIRGHVELPVLGTESGVTAGRCQFVELQSGRAG